MELNMNLHKYLRPIALILLVGLIIWIGIEYRDKKTHGNNRQDDDHREADQNITNDFLHIDGVALTLSANLK